MNILNKVGPDWKPMAILSCWEYICEINVNCTSLVDNFKSLWKFILLILGVSNLYNVSTPISTTSSRGTFVKRLLNQKKP